MTPTLHIQLLGGFRFTADDAPGPPIDSPRLQALLAHLLLQRDAPHARAHLAFQLWPDTTESQAHANLRTLLHRLRQALPDADRLLHIDAQTVQWRGDAPDTLDVADFERSLAQAAAAEQVGDHATARASFIEAVERYHGDLLPGWYDDWVLLERERLRQAFLAGLEKLVVLLEQTNEYAAAIGYAQRLLRHDPLHEATYQHLMRLHALSGDRASAVRVYRTCATVLERELGVEPSPATHESYERLRHMEAQPAVPASSPTSLAAGDRRHNLPIALTSFIGRARERAEVQRLLAITRLLTLTGAGGCGKTRLALAAATAVLSEYSDGVWLVELAALTDAALVPQAVATTLGVREEPQRPLTATLLDALRSRDMVLVLDNCEHLIDACAQLAQTLLGACPHLRILATSRERLAIAGETTWLVPSLSLPDPEGRLRDRANLAPILLQSEAVRLFVERAAVTLPTFTLTQQNALEVAQICRRLDGIPLAIELAATRIAVLSVDQLAARLDDSFRLLTAGSRTAMPRHQTLQATVDWSYDLLSEAEQALFRRLAVFVGGWILEAAEAVCGGEGISVAEVLELLAHLVDKSLVVVESQPHGAVRYRLLETIRTYALKRLEASGELEAIRRHHAEYYLALAETAEPELLGAQQRAWSERLAAELDNLRAVLTWFQEGGPTKGEVGLRVAGALGQFWELRGSWTEGRTWLAEFLAVTETLGGTPARAKGLVAAGALAFHHGDYQAARSLCEEGLAICRALHDQHGSAWALIYLGWMANDWGNYTAAHTFCTESLAICRELGDQQGIVRSLSILGLRAYFQGDFAGPRPLFEEALAIARQSNDRWGVAWSLRHLGLVLAAAANYGAALQLQEESLLIWRELGDKRNIAWELWGLGMLAFAQRDYTAALARYQEGLSISVELGSKFGMMLMLTGFAGLAAGQAQPERAVRLAGAAGALRETIGVSIPPFFLGQLERWLAPARQALSEQACAAAWAAGRALSFEQAIAEAVANSP